MNQTDAHINDVAHLPGVYCPRCNRAGKVYEHPAQPSIFAVCRECNTVFRGRSFTPWPEYLDPPRLTATDLGEIRRIVREEVAYILKALEEDERITATRRDQAGLALTGYPPTEKEDNNDDPD